MSRDPLHPEDAPETTYCRAVIERKNLDPCNWDRRLLNFLIDMAVYIVILSVVVLTTGIALKPAGEERLEDPVDEEGFQVVYFIGLIVYYLMFEFAVGQTPAKFLTGTRVVSHDGDEPSFGQILGRTLGRFIPFDPISFIGYRSRGWHDLISRTMVVRVEDLRSGR